MCLPALRLDWDCSQQVSPKNAIISRKCCHRYHVNVMRASPAQSCPALEALLEGAVPAGAPVLCPCSFTHPVWEHRRLQGLTRCNINCFRPQGWGTAATFQLNCFVSGATSTLGTLLKVQSLSSPTFVVFEDPSWSLLHKELFWTQLCCWHLLFHLLVFPKLGYKFQSFPLPRDCI